MRLGAKIFSWVEIKEISEREIRARVMNEFVGSSN
jgi:hypothetical protein